MEKANHIGRRNPHAPKSSLGAGLVPVDEPVQVPAGFRWRLCDHRFRVSLSAWLHCRAVCNKESVPEEIYLSSSAGVKWFHGFTAV